MPWLHFLVFLILIPAVLDGFIGTFLWRKKRREGRYPLPEDLRVMRMPGECLRQDLQRLEEWSMYAILGAVFLPLVLAWLPLQLFVVYPWLWLPGILLSSGALSLLGLGLGIWWMVRLTEKIRDRKLGMLGERVVADQLEALKTQDFAIFHDVPCLGSGGRFNLDHVVVGRGAVAVIETKTRRKKRGVNSSKDNEVKYDGMQITWPNWKSRSEVTQTLRNRDWLAKRLKEKLNLEPEIHAFIAVPGWKVKTGHGFAVTVQNHKDICGAILNVCRGSMTPTQEDLIVRHLRDLCQDVGWQDV